MARIVTVTADFTREEASALAQFVKRSRFGTYRDCAVDENETRLMLAAVDRIRKGLAVAGFDPR